MIDVMLIDDDVAIRDYMRDIIDWERLELRLVCEAGDSETARELYQLHHPQIVITDINIPIISGLELAKEFIAADKEVRIIVITGYGDFEDVRDSISLGAVDLLSKPIRPEEINGTLQKAINHFAQIRRQFYTEQALNELLKENQSLLQERCIAQLLARPPRNGEEQSRRQLELLSLDFPHRYFAVVRIYLEERSDEMDGITFSAAFKRLCETTFAANGFRVFSYFAGQEDRLDMMVNYPFENGDDRTEAVLAKLLEETRFYFQTGYSAFIGSQVERLSDLYRSAEQADFARNIGDGDGVVNYRNIGRMNCTPRLGSEQIIAQLLGYARTFNYLEFREALDGLCAGAPLESLQAFALELLSELSNLCLESGAYPWSNVNYPKTVAELFGAADSDAVCRFLQEACKRMIDTLYQQRTKSKNQLIRMAKGYLRDHLGDPNISLDSVSSHIGLSKIYFCQLFHKEEGVSFNSYLNMERVDRAKLLLRTTSKKIFEISGEVGYNNPKYFNYVFKRLTGVTPLEYRKAEQA